MNMQQIIISTIALIITIPSLIWFWLNHKAKIADKKQHIAERDQSINMLADSETRCDKIKEKADWFFDLFNSSNEMIIAYGVTDQEMPTNLLAVNDAACRTLGYTRDALLKMTPLEIETIHEPMVQRSQHTDVELLTLSNEEILAQDSKYASRNFQHLIKRIHASETVIYDGSFVTKNKHRIPVEITVHHLGKPEDNRIVCTARDITNRKKSRLALLESEQRFEDLFTASPIGVAIYDAQRNLININLACLRSFGSPGKAEFEKIDMFNNKYLPAEAKDNIARGKTVQCEAVFDFNDLLHTHNVITSRRGKAHFEILFSNMGVNHEHNPLGFLVQIHDITEHREIEAALQLRESQLRQSKKMEAIGTMAGGIAHDFNNILTPILGYSEIGIELTPPEDRMHKFMEEIRTSTMRAKELVNQILIFSRQSEESEDLIHLTSIIKEVSKQQKTALPKTIKVSCSTKAQRDLVLANPTQIHQVLTNLCTNAAYAMKSAGGELNIHLTNFTMGWRHRHEFPQLKKGNYVRISIKDTGAGIPEKNREKIFDPFFSTKPSGEGTGMGLSVVHGIINSLEGAIALVSEIGKGSTFHVALPLKESETNEESTVWVPPKSDNERILFVDDEEKITQMANLMLTSLGYKATVTTSSLKALQIFKENPDDFDLLISDQVMPDMTGSELAIKVRSIRPEMPIMICSGFTGKLSGSKAEELGVNKFMVKPITRRDLGESIQELLETDATEEITMDAPHPADVRDSVDV